MERRSSRFSLDGISTIAIYFRPIHLFARQSVMNVNATHHILTIIIILILSQVWLYDLHLFSITKIRLVQWTAAGSPQACPTVYGLKKSWTDRPHRQRLQGNLTIWLIRYVTGHIDSIQLLSHLPSHCEPYSGATGFSSLLNMAKTVNLLASDNHELDKMSEGKLWVTETMYKVHISWFQISRPITLVMTGATYYGEI